MGHEELSNTIGTFGPVGGDLASHNPTGVVGGGQLGCDYQAGMFVVGVQGFTISPA